MTDKKHKIERYKQYRQENREYYKGLTEEDRKFIDSGEAKNFLEWLDGIYKKVQ